VKGDRFREFRLKPVYAAVIGGGKVVIQEADQADYPDLSKSAKEEAASKAT
jgi:hypothetical protein